MRAYLLVIASLTVLLLPGRYGYSWSARDTEDFAASPHEENDRTDSKDRALFSFVLYSGACFVGVGTLAGGKK